MGLFNGRDGFRWARRMLAGGTAARVAAMAVCVALSAPFAPSPLLAASSDGGGASAEATRASLPGTEGLHPVDYSLQQLGRFSSGLAAVKRLGKWGYVDKAGKLVIPFRYDEATPFDGNWAAVSEKGRWGIVDREGNSVAVHKPLAKLSRFSEGLAAAKAKAGGMWGYVDWTGEFVIKPQFDQADAFSRGLAAVAVQGTWFYVTPTGTIALVTPHYRSYSFTADGLALAQEKRDGLYGFIRRNGTWAIEPAYPEARPFSQGLAPVRIGNRWGYVTPTGATAIPPLYPEAYPFSGGLALVMESPSRVFFVDATGSAAHAASFAKAEGYSEGVAVVGDGTRFWYVDESGAKLPLGEAVLKETSDAGGCMSGVSMGVSTNYVNGLTSFQIVNQGTLQWNVAGKDTWQEAHPSCCIVGMAVFPGLPKTVDSALGPKAGQYAFLHRYEARTGDATGKYPLFDLTLTSGDYTVVLSNVDDYTAPPPPTGHPWWDYLEMAYTAESGLFSVVTGNWKKAAVGLFHIASAAYDIAQGVTDGTSSNNENGKTDNVLLTSLTVRKGSDTLQPLNGGFCGGDSYTVSDGQNYVFTVTTIKSALSPPVVQLSIVPFATYFAQNAYGKLDMFRKGLEPDGHSYTAPPASCIYAIAMADWSDSTNAKPCSTPPAFPSYDYLSRGSSLEPGLALDWWNFANNVNTLGSKPDAMVQVQRWMRVFGGTCGTLSSTCPNANPMTASPTSFDATTDGDACEFAITVSSPAAPVTVPDLPDGWFGNAGDCARMPPLSPCKYTLRVPGGGDHKVTLTDGLTKIPVSARCTSKQMRVSPLYFEASSSFQTGKCDFTVTVTTPKGSVHVTPWNIVEENNCPVQTDKTCTIRLGIPELWEGTRVDLSDGVTTQPITVTCDQQTIESSQPGQMYRIPPGSGTCSERIDIQYARASVVTSPPIQAWLASSTCVGPQEACSMTFNVPVGTPSTAWVPSDGITKSVHTQTLVCQPCGDEPMFLPWGTTYTTSQALGYKTTVLMNCVQLPNVEVVQIPAGGAVDFTACTAKECTAQVYAPVGGTFVLRDSRGTHVSFDVEIAH